MKSYIFACNSFTMGECLNRNLLGVAKPNVNDISIGDIVIYTITMISSIWIMAGDF